MGLNELVENLEAKLCLMRHAYVKMCNMIEQVKATGPHIPGQYGYSPIWDNWRRQIAIINGDEMMDFVSSDPDEALTYCGGVIDGLSLTLDLIPDAYGLSGFMSDDSNPNMNF
jgi:hypothetical protein